MEMEGGVYGGKRRGKNGRKEGSREGRKEAVHERERAGRLINVLARRRRETV